MPHQENTPSSFRVIVACFPGVRSTHRCPAVTASSSRIHRRFLSELPDRRLFLKTLAFPCAAACAVALTRNCFAVSAPTWGFSRRRRFALSGSRRGSTRNCPTRWFAANCARASAWSRTGSRGYCRVRENRNGTYYTLVHSRVVSRSHRSHREEAVLPFSSRTDGVFRCHRGLQRELQVLPELGDLASQAGRLAGTIPASEGPGVIGQGQRVCSRWPSPTASRPSSTST